MSSHHPRIFPFRTYYLLLTVLLCGLVDGLSAQSATSPAQSITSATQSTSSAQSVTSTAQGTTATPHYAPATTANTPSHSLLLGPGDLVDMTVYNVPELTTKTRVTSNGEMYCPLIGYMHVGGLTADEAQAAIETRLSEFVKNPHVSVFVAEYASQGVSLLGEVMRPGIYPVLGQQHLLDVLSAAGGLTEKSGRILTVTHRSDPDKPLTILLPRNLSDNSETNVAVFPGDTIIVHKADVVYVVGDVLRPSGLVMDSGGLTVLQALALSGGGGKTAKLSGAKLLRKGPNGMAETPVDVKKMLQAKAPDMPLEANDILIVPSSTGKILAGRTLEAAIQAATLISVTAIP